MVPSHVGVRHADITCTSFKSFTHVIGYILVGTFMGCLNTPPAYKYIASLTYHDRTRRDGINFTGDACRCARVQWQREGGGRGHAPPAALCRERHS